MTLLGHMLMFGVKSAGKMSILWTTMSLGAGEKWLLLEQHRGGQVRGALRQDCHSEPAWGPRQSRGGRQCLVGGLS